LLTPSTQRRQVRRRGRGPGANASGTAGASIGDDQVVEDNLAIIDRAVSEARQALDEDPGNGYLSDYLSETRRRKLDLLRRATSLAEDLN
jgi:hypothetical protein